MLHWQRAHVFTAYTFELPEGSLLLMSALTHVAAHKYTRCLT
jgi:hypothetical protein